ncbi:hypothetical protein WH47_10159 [Habropoda laboriosa]|uniref:Uncharacterized protein n=1 Tax=Habropoda laboriosa TaxID=597456 RepID=A0A0L7R493_9HYME|nr:hypothetical protein WH47_10159 [Habropoda laboriosa]
MIAGGLTDIPNWKRRMMYCTLKTLFHLYRVPTEEQVDVVICENNTGNEVL